MESSKLRVGGLRGGWGGVGVMDAECSGSVETKRLKRKKKGRAAVYLRKSQNVSEKLLRGRRRPRRASPLPCRDDGSLLAREILQRSCLLVAQWE